MSKHQTVVPTITRTGRVSKKPKRVAEIESDDDGEERGVSKSSDTQHVDIETGIVTSEDESSEDEETSGLGPAATTTSTVPVTTPNQGSAKGKHAREWEPVGYSIPKTKIPKLVRPGKCHDREFWDDEKCMKVLRGQVLDAENEDNDR
jgi:hypothetical protein